MTSIVGSVPIVDQTAVRAGRVLPGPEPHPPTPPGLPPDPKPPKPVHQSTSAQRPWDEAADSVPLDDLVLRPVRLGGSRVGTVVDVVLSPGLRHVLGVDVVLRGRHRFLPWVALRPRSSDLALANPAALDASRGLSLLFAFGTRLSETCHRRALLVDRFGDIRHG